MFMEIEGAIKIESAASDSHFRLVPCPACHSDNVAYVQYLLGIQEPWKVLCFDCGHEVDRAKIFRHEARAAWNNHVKETRDARDDSYRTAETMQRLPVQEAWVF